jgi:L-ascorbate metabolism protein UlaG (beta-lactamase superfamily)
MPTDEKPFTPMHRRWMKRLGGSSMLMKFAGWLGRSRGKWRPFDQPSKLPQPTATPDLTHWNKQELAAVWIGHATVLLRIGGLNILTDPVFSSRIGFGFGPITAGPKRLIAPALTLDELPPIDLVLLSHAHFDHLDRPTLYRLGQQCKNAAVITSENNADLVTDLNFASVSELKWGQLSNAKDIDITAVQVKHWGARTITDKHRGYCGFLIESKNRRILFAGDTAYQEHFKFLSAQHGNRSPLDAIIIGIGAYDPWIWNHVNPEQAWELAHHAGAKAIIPVHHRTFRQSREPLAEPMERLLAAAGSETDRVVIREIGQMWKDTL